MFYGFILEQNSLNVSLGAIFRYSTRLFQHEEVWITAFVKVHRLFWVFFFSHCGVSALLQKTETSMNGIETSAQIDERDAELRACWSC